MVISESTVRGLVEATASDQPAPGCGAAGAVTLSLAAACAAKAFAISARHKSGADLPGAANAARTLASSALEHAQQDSDGFRRWLHGEDQALPELRSAGSGLLKEAQALIRLIDAHAAVVIPDLQADLMAARRLLEAAAAIQADNLSALTPDP